MIDHDRSACGLAGQTVVQHHIQEFLVDMYPTVVGDVAKLAEVIHELANAGTSRADHIRKLFLSDWGYPALRFSRRTKLSHDEQCAGKTLFAVIEQLIDEVFSSSDSTHQDELQEDV